MKKNQPYHQLIKYDAIIIQGL